MTKSIRNKVLKLRDESMDIKHKIERLKEKDIYDAYHLPIATDVSNLAYEYEKIINILMDWK